MLTSSQFYFIFYYLAILTPLTVIVLNTLISFESHVIAQQRTQWMPWSPSTTQSAAPTIQGATYYPNISQNLEHNLNIQQTSNNNNNNYARVPSNGATRSINARPVNADGFNQEASINTTSFAPMASLPPVRRPPQSIQGIQQAQRLPQTIGIQFEKQVNPQQLQDITQGNEIFSKRLFKVSDF